MSEGMTKLPRIFEALEYINENESCTMQDLLETKIAVAYLLHMKIFANEKGWIDIQKQGKKHIMLITEKGKNIVNLYCELKKEME